jgi:hypothetical protein
VSSHTLSFIIDWGTFPDWVAAVGTVGAFIAAVVIFGVTVRQNRLADRRSQARLFDAWVTTARWADYPEHSIGAVSQKLQVAIDCSNASGQSMRNVMADFLFANQSVDGLYDLHLIPPTTPGNLERRWFWLLSVKQTSQNREYTDRILRGFLRMNMTFTDASGSRWIRTWKGELESPGKPKRQKRTKKQVDRSAQTL